EVLDAESGIKDKADAVEIKRVHGRVSFDSVSAGYNTTDSVVDGLNFSANPGQIVAIMGAPGSGKSTLVHLIARFYDVNKGKITIDDLDIRDIKVESVRKNVGVVFQDVFLFAASIKENIAYGLEDVTLEEVMAVSKIAQLHEFIEGLPQAYDTLVGERGVTLSGGQRQRLAIARTLLLDPPILILDDSTSSVDSRTESEIQKALESVMKNRTVFVIAHRATTISQADSIIVLDKGKIVERGTHDELLELKGNYHRIYNHQINVSNENSTTKQKIEKKEKGALR
ncbi:MAG: ABC transporter ATP-binding protein/permease, partial [Dehalococcoidia bacterium]|nr:ABC transporter ATP-binding protein/permease [Dehalococcoidia bacterium]